MKKLEKSKSEQISKAVTVLAKGGVIILPTDTVYGLACKWDNFASVARIKRIKSSYQNFPILVANLAQAHAIAKINPHAQSLINIHWPGGLTIIVSDRKTNQKIGLRMPASQIALSVIEQLGSPIVGTSANFHGQKPPISESGIDPKLKSIVDFVLEGNCEKGIESTVVDTTVTPAKILRRGAVNLA